MIRGKCHRFSDLCFVKVRQWEVGGGGSVCGEGSLLSLRTAPEEAPRVPRSGTKTACVALGVCVCVSVC